MTIDEPTKYIRKPFEVSVMQVTEENIHEVAEWCQGEVHEVSRPGNDEIERYIQVKVRFPRSERQTQAFLGDYILYGGYEYKVYTPKAFEKSFEPVGNKRDQLNKIRKVALGTAG